MKETPSLSNFGCFLGMRIFVLQRQRGTLYQFISRLLDQSKRFQDGSKDPSGHLEKFKGFSEEIDDDNQARTITYTMFFSASRGCDLPGQAEVISLRISRTLRRTEATSVLHIQNEGDEFCGGYCTWCMYLAWNVIPKDIGDHPVRP